MLSFICVWINNWVNNLKAGDLSRYRAHYDITVMDRVSHDLELFDVFLWSAKYFTTESSKCSPDLYGKSAIKVHQKGDNNTAYNGIT